MNKNGVFADPALPEDRFDFGGESLTEEDVSEYRDQAGAEDITKGKKIAHQPGYRLDEQKHKWVKIGDEHKTGEFKVSAPFSSINKEIIGHVSDLDPMDILISERLHTDKHRRIADKVDDLKDSISVTRNENLDQRYHYRGLELAYDWSEGVVFKLGGLRQIVADMEGITFDKEASIRETVKSIEGRYPSESSLKALMGLSDVVYFSIDQEHKGEVTKNPIKETLKSEHAFTKEITRRIFGEELDVYRCVYGPAAENILGKISKGESVELEDSPLSSYTTDKRSAQVFAGTVGSSAEHAFIFHKRIKAESVYFAWYANSGMLSMPEQKEIVIGSKDNKFNIDKDSVDWIREYESPLVRVEDAGEFEYAMDLSKGKPIAHQPGYYFDRQEHRWKKTHAREDAGATAFKKATPTDFRKALSQSKRLSFLSDYPESELAGMDLHLREDGEVGFAIKDGYIANLFNNDGEGAGAEAMIDAIASGGNNLDCFDGFLTEYYKTFGFKVKEQEKFEDKYAPKDWNYESYGRPDIIFMEYGGKNRDAAAIREYRNKRLKEYESVADVHKALSVVLEKAKERI